MAGVTRLPDIDLDTLQPNELPLVAGTAARENVRFYEHFGFLRGTPEAAVLGVQCWHMRRDRGRE